jgi:Regulator of G-protein signalling DHEX domain
VGSALVFYLDLLRVYANFSLFSHSVFACATNIVVCLLSQTPYYWPSSAAHGHTPDNLEYAIYLAKRSLRNKQRHGLEDYELVRHTSYFTSGKAFASQRCRYET